MLDLTLLLAAEQLTAPRQALLAALQTLCTDQPEAARQALGLSTAQDDELDRNRQLASAPTAPAWQVYSGVLYQQLDSGSLTRAQRARLAESTWIASALFGFVAFDNPIPAYRLSGDTTLPGLGGLARYWMPHLTPQLAAEQGLILDLRSGSYVKLAPLPKSVAPRAVTVRVLEQRPTGPPRLVTHFNKATKGRLVRLLAQQKRFPTEPQALLPLAASLGADVTLLPGAPQTLEILLRGCWGDREVGG